ncbi:carbonic anhydrase [Corynebacterium ulceribovis]|uniref:carbonic anhydrase n=1 Tax=Corynebacterium ulceribovis TaxID=487732 RepID=UPI00036FA95E|nr:carbonic anhydrase [Corynebacterium ulceribovis]
MAQSSSPEETANPSHIRPTTPAETWQALHDGNRRFMVGESIHPHQDAQRRLELTAGQKPHTVVLACSDSRVPVELIFDQGLGDIFVIRTAGHITDLSVLASLEFAVVSLKVNMVVVLGHESCGAVKAAQNALDGGELPGGFQLVLVEKVTPSLLAAKRNNEFGSDAFEKRHVREIVEHVLERSPEIQAGIQDGTLGLAGMRYRLVDGMAEPVVKLGLD